MFDFRPTLSSTTSAIAKGIVTKGIKFPINDEKNVDVKTKEIPPDVGIGDLV